MAWKSWYIKTYLLSRRKELEVIILLSTFDMPLLFKFYDIGTPEFSVASLMSRHCCNKNTVTCFKLITQATIERIRETVYSVSETEQIQIVLDYMLEHSQGNGSILYSVGGQMVCETCFRYVYGFRYNRFSAMKEKFKRGVVLAEHGRLGRGERSDVSVRVISWLRVFVDKIGDRMPTSTAVHLPSCLNKVRCVCFSF